MLMKELRMCVGGSPSLGVTAPQCLGAKLLEKQSSAVGPAGCNGVASLAKKGHQMCPSSSSPRAEYGPQIPSQVTATQGWLVSLHGLAGSMDGRGALAMFPERNTSLAGGVD